MNAQEEAEKIIKMAWFKDIFPVDPISVAEKLGVKVINTTELPPEVSGALIKEAGKDPRIILCATDSKNRLRFSCAHELGHYVSRVQSSNADLEYEYIDLRSDLSSQGIDKDEIFANEFAANLLMPEAAVKKLFKKKSNLEMALFFGVSAEAIKYRLKKLKLS